MTNKERIQKILNREDVDRCGFWMGDPIYETLLKYFEELNISTNEELTKSLESEIVWISGEGANWDWNYKMFDSLGGQERHSLSQAGIFAETEDVNDVVKTYWPNPVHYDFSSLKVKFDFAKKNNLAVFGGMWSPFWHVASDYFGMENFLIKMYTDEDVVLKVLEKVTDFYVNANKYFLEMYHNDLDAYFFGNDFGTQLDCIMSPEMFEKFMLPSIKRIIDLPKSYNLKICMHSCGSIDKIIPMLIDIGINVLHPIQAKAKNMDAESLQKKYGDKLIFMGGVDTQDILPFATEEEVTKEVERLKKIFGKHYIVSASHEGILPNIPLKNMIAMKNSAKLLK